MSLAPIAFANSVIMADDADGGFRRDLKTGKSLSFVRCRMLLFRPWIGHNYHSTGFNGHRILILGESHYGKPEDEVPSFTIECIEGMAKAKRGHAFFTKTAKLFLEREPGVPLSQAERSTFWDSVAFFNYVQSFPSSTARKRPTQGMWQVAASVLPSVIADVQPSFVLVLGRALSDNLPDLQTQASLFHITHPSSFGFRPQEWRPRVLSALASAGSTQQLIQADAASQRCSIRA